MSGSSDAELLQSFLADRDELCPRCRYNLRGLTNSTCPECGETLVLRVGLERWRPVALITGLVGLAAAAGFNALVLAVTVIMVATGQPGGPTGSFYIYSVAALMAESASLYVWLHYWWQITRLKNRTQWQLAALCWVLPAVSLCSMVVMIIYGWP